jgi:PAS domain S-box-containing protein
MVISRGDGLGGATYVSPNVRSILGYSAAELVGSPDFWLDKIHPEDRESFSTAATNAFALNAAGFERSYRYRHGDGTYRWIEDHSQIEYDETGAPATIIGCGMDVTTRHEAEDVLRESEHRTQLTLDTAPEAFVAMDPNGRIVGWNAEAERVFGWSKVDAIGLQMVDTIVQERYRPLLREGLKEYGTIGVAAVIGRRIEIQACRRDGTEVPIELTIKPMHLGDHTVVFNAFLRNVTERKVSEESQRAANVDAAAAGEEADRANRAKSEYLSRMSHELRTPLNAILGFGQLLESEDITPKQRESVERILRAGKHLLQLSDDVLDIAKIEQGDIALSIEPVKIEGIVRDSLELVRPSAASRHVRIWAESSYFDRHVLADRQSLKQVLLNLLSNAVKYNEVGGTVSISCELAASGRLRIAVTDSGPGVSVDLIGLLFVPFERLGAERTTVTGTGIGLSISKRLVELMGGEIGVESQEGHGSTFWLELEETESPLARAASAERAPRVPEPVQVKAGAILYVEDNLSNLRLVEVILERRPGTRLITALQGSLALELASQHQPDLILLDVHLPDLEGDEVLRRLREDPLTHAIPVVMVSADATPGTMQGFIEAGARAYLTKPLDTKRFLEVIDEVLAESKPRASADITDHLVTN